MPTFKINYCDNCNKEMDIKDMFLIYKIYFYSKAKYNSEEIDYLAKNDCALMLCSKECIGQYISKLLNGNII